MFKGILTAWHYRTQLWTIFWKQYTAPYKHSALGLIWAFILPVVPISAYIIVRGIILPSGGADNEIHGAVYVAIGASLWFYLTDLIQRPQVALKRQQASFSFGRLPGLGVALIAWFQAVIELGLRMPLIVVAIILFSPHNVDGLWLASAGFVGATLGAFALGLLVASAAAFIPDLKIITEVSMRYLLFFSFVIFPLPKTGAFVYLYKLNPIAVYIDNIRNAIVYGSLLEPGLYFGYVTGSILLFVAASLLFLALESHLKEAYS
ncbi:MAG: ABC transporter permease [Maricaulis sp.]|nr:ABC transporter permease [Maricaulis sp.]